jgi:hypothetical protein
MTKYAALLAVTVAASLVGVLSCITPKAPPALPPPPSPPSEADIIRKGAALFSQGKIDEAETAWADIPDPAKRDSYLSFAKAYEDFDAVVAGAEKILSETGPEAAVAAVKDSGGPPPAPESVETDDPRELRARLARLGDEAGRALAARADDEEKAADLLFAAARSSRMGNKEGVARAVEAAKLFASARRLFLAASEWKSQAAEDVARTEAKAFAAETLQKSLLKESLLSFPNRMGELFARLPLPSAKIDDKALLAFAGETASMISGGISDFEETVAAYPDLLDQATVERLRASARGLAARFARIETALKAVKDRGKPVMPMIIGIFNPEPDDPQRSRPATFKGSSAAGPEWWWGIADIPKGVAQDLVVTMSDPRPVRVYAAGLGPDGKRPASDLVNPLFKVGNSWPVLNAGSRLKEGVFHIEVGPGRDSLYEGVAVVYKSFMMRTR